MMDENEREGFLVPLCLPDLVKVGDDLVQEPQAFQALLVDVTLSVKFFEIRHRGKHHTDTVIGLVVEVLSGGGYIQKVQLLVLPRRRRDVRL